jgi:antitoxin (DNA-binding transcriptional repressor) of toxin-antitoxin stability system
VKELAISVEDAARDFRQVLARIENEGEPTVVFRAGKPVARIVPFPPTATYCAELAARWENIERLPPEEAEVFARDIEDARKNLPLPKSRWD